jgi:hypothetical protein
MTRILSDILGADEHRLRLGIHNLERASGGGSADVRLSADMLQASKRKLLELGLDPHDTTGPELYAALKQRLKADNARLSRVLQKAADSQDIVASVAHALRIADIPRSSFALKLSVLKTLLKKQPPKHVMKQLGYRSLDSMLKHESAAALLALAWLQEAPTWQKTLRDQYKRLQATDFEVRDITISTPDSERWTKLADSLVADQKHNVIALKELGAVVLLPLPTEAPESAMTATLTLALHSMNEIRAASTYLKLCQVKPDFGQIVQQVIADEPYLGAELLDQPVSWQMLQRYFARFTDAFRSELFEPHIQADDLSWHSVEDVLEQLEPSLAFWRGTEHLGLVYDHQPVSLNIVDVALAACNKLPYANRIVHYLQHSLRAELLLQYLQHERVEQTVLGHLQTELVTEPVRI